MKRIVYETSEGGVGIITPAPGARMKGESERDFVERIRKKRVPAGARWKVIEERAYPADREFRDAWVFDAEKGIGVDLAKAGEILMARLRLRRDEALAALDVPFMRAVEAADAAEQKRVAAEKQKLRDLPATVSLDGVRNVIDLKNRWPRGLRKWEP